MILVDSSLLAAYAILEDDNHARSEAVWHGIFDGEHGEPLLPHEILSETITVVFVRTKSLSTASAFAKTLRACCSIVFADEAISAAALEIFSSQKSTRLSFADCILLALSRKLGVEKIATFDHEFKKVPGIKVVE